MKYKLLITAGPTREPIDPVRFISNYSTGTLGYALAKAARARGHQVTLISGPTGLPCPTGVKKIDVETAAELQKQVTKSLPKADALIMGAAVGDFRSIRVASQKIKRSGAVGSLRLWQLDLIENPDIVAEAAGRREPHQAVIGFGLETEGLLSNARRKLAGKHLDAIVATRYSPKLKGCGPFGKDPVSGMILERGGKPKPFQSMRKEILAQRILDTVEGILVRRAKKPR